MQLRKMKTFEVMSGILKREIIKAKDINELFALVERAVCRYQMAVVL